MAAQYRGTKTRGPDPAVTPPGAALSDGTTVPGRPARPSRDGRGTRFLPYLLLLPTLVATALLLGYPLVRNLLISFQTLEPFQLIQHTTQWNGFGNYTDQLTSSEFWHTAGRSVAFTAANVVLIMVAGTLIGLLLNRLGKPMRLLLSTGLVLAWAMPQVAGTTVYQWLFDTQNGVVNWGLNGLGWHAMQHYNWFSHQLSTFAVITLMIVWGSIPFVALNLFAGLTTVSAEIFEAARMDGASAWRTFWQVVFPMLKPFFLSTTFLEIIWVFKAFTQVYALNAGGPEGLTETLPVYAYVEGFGNQHFGTGAAISMLTIVILVALMSYYFRVILKEEDEL
ncbi:carbohydrate ABC transporter permease [Streptomyces sp. 8L]|uniref:carbohydrate ABC transporter permease n=1 Tax=Streptomyces sp. 8L TaxID=2877242 RepID=UPI001CD36AA1|nr:sugar ABC transporter permease [Streptomyces sp. 8L]MCA1222724.1 sugar ABC transporter permease [Streptomyces sp. 8L]